MEYLVGQPDLAALLMRAYELKGDLPDVIDGSFQSIIAVDSMLQPEYQALRRMPLLQGGVFVGAVAAQFSYALLTTRGGIAATATRILAVVEKVLVSNPTAANQSYIMMINADNPGGAGPASNPRDDRFSGAVSGSAFESAYGVAFGNNALSPAGPIVAGRTLRFTIPPGGNIQIEGPWVLTNRLDPGGSGFSLALAITPSLVNLPLEANFFWRERQILQSELL